MAKLLFWATFIKFIFYRLLRELNVTYETSIFWSMFMLHEYWWKHLSRKNGIDTSLSQTPVRTLTLSTAERIFGYFSCSRWYHTTKFSFAYMNPPYHLGSDPESRPVIGFKRKIAIAWNWRPDNKNSQYRSWCLLRHAHVSHTVFTLLVPGWLHYHRHLPDVLDALMQENLSHIRNTVIRIWLWSHLSTYSNS